MWKHVLVTECGTTIFAKFVIFRTGGDVRHVKWFDGNKEIDLVCFTFGGRKVSQAKRNGIMDSLFFVSVPFKDGFGIVKDWTLLVGWLAVALQTIGIFIVDLIGDLISHFGFQTSALRKQRQWC